MDGALEAGALDFRELRAFAVIARSSSITRAAYDLGIGQPDLTKLLHRLEAKLGVSLVARHSRGINLTSEGTLLLERTERVLGMLREAVITVEPSCAMMRTLTIPPSLQRYATRPSRIAHREAA